MTKNYGLFNKYLEKLSNETISKFGSQENVILFLQALCESGNSLSAAKNSAVLPLQLPLIIHKDKYLNKCVKLALQYAVDKAEGVLYDRAINGYEDITYNKDNQPIATKRKYCSKSLLEYLKANSEKYQTRKNDDRSNRKSANNAEQKARDKEMARMIDVSNFGVESYGAESSSSEEK
ncbi:hypothetical protein [Candidatus Tisiphia endosymbiont of Ditula angustiorana]|uniref:hypothetical protein n=1 Tax=Candidatus Tisiphia endosymbiont of Ditula angustiorana TaxID=3066272 RepID=UPI00312C6E2B